MSAQVIKKLGCQKNCGKSRARPESPGMRDPEASEVQGQGREGRERVCNVQGQRGSKPPTSCCWKQSCAVPLSSSRRCFFISDVRNRPRVLSGLLSSKLLTFNDPYGELAFKNTQHDPILSKSSLSFPSEDSRPVENTWVQIMIMPQTRCVAPG